MTKQLGELTIKKSADYYNRVVKALEDAGFTVVLITESTINSYYIVAESEDK